MIETMEFYGRTVVAPILHGDRELCEKPYVYFQKYKLLKKLLFTCE